jgi:hypothetical protein
LVCAFLLCVNVENVFIFLVMQLAWLAYIKKCHASGLYLNLYHMAIFMTIPMCFKQFLDIFLKVPTLYTPITTVTHPTRFDSFYR